MSLMHQLAKGLLIYQREGERFDAKETELIRLIDTLVDADGGIHKHKLMLRRDRHRAKQTLIECLSASQSERIAQRQLLVWLAQERLEQNDE